MFCGIWGWNVFRWLLTWRVFRRLYEGVCGKIASSKNASISGTVWHARQILVRVTCTYAKSVDFELLLICRYGSPVHWWHRFSVIGWSASTRLWRSWTSASADGTGLGNAVCRNSTELCRTRLSSSLIGNELCSSDAVQLRQRHRQLRQHAWNDWCREYHQWIWFVQLYSALANTSIVNSLRQFTCGKLMEPFSESYAWRRTKSLFACKSFRPDINWFACFVCEITYYNW